VIDDFPGSIEAGSARARLAAIAAGAVRSAAQLRAGRKLWEARNALSIAYFATMDRAERDALGAELEATNEALLEARRSVGEIVSVRVKPGDSLSAIAKRKGVSWRLVKRLSGLRSTVIRIGQKLKTLEGRVAIEVSKKRFELVLTIDGHFLRHWMIATGKDDRTPVAAFKITERIIEPTWYSPDGVYPFGHEKNILGTRWLGFERTEELAGFGIHGTRYPESVGTAASMGCLRMRNADVEELFDYIPQGCAVTIRP
jgi:LysM repeat protein